MTNAHCCVGVGRTPYNLNKRKRKKGFHNSDKYLQIAITYHQDKQTLITQ